MRFFFILLMAFNAPLALAKNTLAKTRELSHPAYLGVMGGFGSTTWKGLVPAVENQNEALSLSTPVSAREGGGVWGIFAGYEFNPCFALEANYQHYPDAEVNFDEFSLFAFDNDGQTALKTKTDTLSLMAKMMVLIPDSSVRIFSAAGAARIWRKDMLIEDSRLAPAFSAGANVQLSDHFMGELAGYYTAGYGESDLNPANHYIPFLYSINLKLAYRV